MRGYTDNAMQGPTPNQDTFTVPAAEGGQTGLEVS
jgi:hypothetical protein